MPTATIQTKNSAIDSTREIFSADQVSMCRSCSRARRGPRPAPRTLPVRPVVSAGRGAAERDTGSPGRTPAPTTGTAWVASIGGGAVAVPARPAAGRLTPVAGGTGGPGVPTGPAPSAAGRTPVAGGPSGVTGCAAGGVGAGGGPSWGVAARAGDSGSALPAAGDFTPSDCVTSAGLGAASPPDEAVPTAVAPVGPASPRSRGPSTGPAASGTPSDAPDPSRVSV